MKISTLSKYGLRAMVYLAKADEICSVKEISVREKIPFDYLAKIFLRLKRAKIIGVKRGIRGGYFLATSPKNISIGQIIRALDGSMAPVNCVDKAGSCSRKNCQTKILWQAVNSNFNKALDSLTLADSIK
jgi:Rrf2 family cysteine metabolism transcriptional repressor